ncbi:MAG TPA: hypothetical protein VG496_03860 [Myxococcales bacterium]|nr:hypothetical protein [Myxococcales bacterium]
MDPLAPTSRIRKLVWPSLVALAGVAAVVPLWCSHFLPFQDAPQHVAAIAAVADHGRAAIETRRWFEVDFLRAQYTGFYVPAVLLARVVGPDVAIRILLSLVALLLPAVSWLLLGSFGRDRRLAVFAPALFHTAPLYIGVYHFVAAVPFALAAIALVERELRSPRVVRALVLAVVALALFYLHVSALAIALGAAGLLAITSGKPFVRMARALAPLAPAVAGVALFALRAPPSSPVAAILPAAPKPSWQSPIDQLHDLARFANVLPGRIDEVVAAALVVIWIVLVRQPGRPRIDRWWRLPLLAGAVFAIYLAAPVSVGYIAYIHLRAVPFLVALVICSALIAPTRRSSALLAAVAALQLAYTPRLVSAYRAFDAEANPAQLEQVLRAAEPGRRLLALMLHRKSNAVHFEPYLHFGLYYELERGGRARFNFGELPWMPLRLRRDVPAQPLPVHWEFYPGQFDWFHARADADYVLVRTPDPEGDGADNPEPGPEFAAGWDLKARAGRWELFEVVRGRRGHSG